MKKHNKKTQPPPPLAHTSKSLLNTDSKSSENSACPNIVPRPSRGNAASNGGEGRGKAWESQRAALQGDMRRWGAGQRTPPLQHTPARQQKSRILTPLLLSSCKVCQNIPGCNIAPFFGSKLNLCNRHNPHDTRTELCISYRSGDSLRICPRIRDFITYGCSQSSQQCHQVMLSSLPFPFPPMKE